MPPIKVRPPRRDRSPETEVLEQENQEPVAQELGAQEPEAAIVDEELLPEHVRAERAAGRAAVLRAQDRHKFEIEAGQRAQQEAEARAAARGAQ